MSLLSYVSAVQFMIGRLPSPDASPNTVKNPRLERIYAEQMYYFGCINLRSYVRFSKDHQPTDLFNTELICLIALLKGKLDDVRHRADSDNNVPFPHSQIILS